MADTNPRMRVQAIRISETLYKAGNRSFDADYRRLTSDADADVSIQALLTLSLFKAADLPDVVTVARAANTGRGVQEVGAWITRPAATGRGGGRGGPTRTPEQQARLQRGETIFNEVCFTCHGSDGRGQPLGGAAPGETMAPPVAGSPRVQGHRDYVIRTLLHGLTGPIDGRTYAQVMAPLGSNPDEWVAAVGSYVRTSFGNTASMITPADVARVRKVTAGRRTMWTPEEIDAALPVPLMPQPTWKASASHNTGIAAGALSLAGWTSATAQQAGMWIQVELPAPVRLAEIQFNSPAGGRGFGIGSLGGYGTGRGVNQASAGGGGGRARGAPPTPGLHPIAYRVQVSMDGTTWSRPVAEGPGLPDLTSIPFTPVRARFVRITQTATPTGSDVPVWSMIGLRLFTPAP
jgi:mono/diheme cytochrome c family protein